MHCGRDHGSTGARPSQLGRMTKIAPICNLLVHDKIRTRTAHFLSEPAPLSARHRENRQRDTGRNGRSFASRRSSRTAGFPSLFSQAPRTTSRTQSSYCCCRPGRKESYSRSRRERRCACGLIEKTCRQTDALTNKARRSNKHARRSPCPLYSQKRTSRRVNSMSALCH